MPYLAVWYIIEIMQFIDAPLSKKKLKEIQKTYGDYIKVTADVEKGVAVVGCELHADGEDLLLQKTSRQDDIWGGGIHLKPSSFSGKSKYGDS